MNRVLKKRRKSVLRIVTPKFIDSSVPDILSSKTFNYVDMENLLVELPDNEAPNEYQPRKQDLPDVITIEDIIAYDYKYEESKRNDLVKLLEEWR